MRLRFPVLALALLAALCGGAAAQDVLAGDGWVVINGFNGNAGDWIPRTTPSPLQSGLVCRMFGGGCQGDGCNIIAMPEEYVRDDTGRPAIGAIK